MSQLSSPNAEARAPLRFSGFFGVLGKQGWGQTGWETGREETWREVIIERGAKATG